MSDIKVGEKYNVLFEMVQGEYGVELLYIPVATGDTWRFRRVDGEEIAVGHFAKLEPCVDIGL